jgi:hypothetical protein
MNKRIMVVAANHIIVKEEIEKIKYIEIEYNDISKAELENI